MILACGDSNSRQIDIYEELVEEYIRQDSLQIDNNSFHGAFLTYEYYELELIDGFVAPPTSPPQPGFSFFNEKVFLEHINNHLEKDDSFFSNDCDINLNFLKK